MKLTPKLAELYGTLQAMPDTGEDRERVVLLMNELENIGQIMSADQVEELSRVYGIVPDPGTPDVREIVTGPDRCPCCGRPLD